MGFDGFVDRWIRDTKRPDLLADLWNNNCLQGLKDTFRVEMVPLNKVWPSIPQKD